MNRILLLFESKRANVNKGGAYKRWTSTRGRKPQLRSIDILRLCLRYLKSRWVTYKLCPICGLIPTSFYVWLDYGMQVLLRVVQKSNKKIFEVRWPSVDEMKMLAALLQRNRRLGPLIAGIIAIIYERHMLCDTYTDSDLKNAYWERFIQANAVKESICLEIQRRMHPCRCEFSWKL